MGRCPASSPFAGIRYAPDLDLAVVTSPPYDVIDADRAGRPRGVARPPTPSTSTARWATWGREARAKPSARGAGGDDAYAAAAATFAALAGRRHARHRRAAHASRSTACRSPTSPAATGPRPGCSVPSPSSGPARAASSPTSARRPKARSDRLDLLRATKANSSAIWGLSLADGLSKLLDPPGAPLGDFTDDDGVRHQAVADRRPRRVRGDQRRRRVGAGGHRRRSPPLRDLPRLSRGGAATTSRGRPPPCSSSSSSSTSSSPSSPSTGCCRACPTASTSRCVGVDLRGDAGRRGAARRARPRHLVGVLPPRAARRRRHPRHRPPRRGPGRSSPSTTSRSSTGRPSSAHAVASGRAQAGVLLRPVGVAEIAEVAEGGDRMPPKTTFFAPKPRTGIVFRSLV